MSLSIPAWFDWRHGVGGSVLTVRATFNPSLVRLARGDGQDDAGVGVLPFNPSLVRLARHYRRPH